MNFLLLIVVYGWENLDLGQGWLAQSCLSEHLVSKNSVVIGSSQRVNPGILRRYYCACPLRAIQQGQLAKNTSFFNDLVFFLISELTAKFSFFNHKELMACLSLLDNRLSSSYFNRLHYRYDFQHIFVVETPEQNCVLEIHEQTDFDFLWLVADRSFLVFGVKREVGAFAWDSDSEAFTPVELLSDFGFENLIWLVFVVDQVDHLFFVFAWIRLEQGYYSSATKRDRIRWCSKDATSKRSFEEALKSA